MNASHKTPLKACSAIIIRENDDKVFVARRSLKKRYFPGEWEMIGGGLEEGETKEACMKREIQEELRCEVVSLKYLKEYHFAGRDFFVFEVRLNKEPDPNCDDFEEWFWFDQSVIEKMDFVLNCKERLLDYFNSRE
jgi:8-oxo-dGTP diphosphatase